MLLKCPECELPVSDKALSCPHCGYPMVSPDKIKPRLEKKRKRLPNGFGQISEMKGHNIRNKFRAMVTVGKAPNGRPVVKPLKPKSHFATYNDAYAALVEYNKHPYDLDEFITVEQLYNKWTDHYFKTLKSDSSCRTIMAAWNYCSSVYNMPVKELRARHIKYCMDEGTAKIRGKVVTATPGIKSRIKSMFNLMLDYALEYELVDKNYARTFNVSDEVLKEMEDTKRGHMPFTDDEINALWQNITIPYVDVLLIQCYGGWRPQELGLIKIKDVDLDNRTIIGGMKTEAGTNRVVPIHSKIYDLVKQNYENAASLGSEYLFNCTDGASHKDNTKLTYDKYSKRFCKIRDQLGLNSNHRAHDGRMHFVTTAKKYNVDEYAIKRIVGHSIQDITEKVYTERDVEWLKTEIEKIR